MIPVVNPLRNPVRRARQAKDVPQYFTRNSIAYTSDGEQVAANVVRRERGKFGKAVLIEEGTANLLSSANSQGFTSPVDVPVVNGSVYTISMTGSGSITLSGVGTGTVTAATPITITANGTTLTLTPNGDTGRVQVEAKAYKTTWQIGGSTRATEMLTIPTANVLNPYEGTIEFWVYLPILRPNGYQPLVSTATYNYFPGPRLLIMREFSGANVNNVCVWDGNGTTEAYLSSNIQLQVGSWYYIAYTWSMAGRKLFINGSLVATNAKSEPIAMGVDINIGSWAASDFLDGYIESFRISTRARSDTEISEAYKSNMPLLADEWITAIL
jgi:hypothetical protein